MTSAFFDTQGTHGKNLKYGNTNKKKRFDKTGKEIASSESSKYERYEIEAIRDHRVYHKYGRLEFFVKWMNYPESDNTWEPFRMFCEDVPNMVKDYLFNFFDQDGNVVSDMIII